jgi:hypothetical protein
MHKTYDIAVIFIIIDEIVKKLKNEAFISKSGRGRKPNLTESELLTIAVIGHLEQIQSLKRLHRLIQSLGFENFFNDIPSYEQFTIAMRNINYLLMHVLNFFSFTSKSNDSRTKIIDSTPLPITKYTFKYIKWANNTSSLSKCLDEWYQGYKLHMVTNEEMEIVSHTFTTASVHDSNMLNKKGLLSNVSGDLVGDKGYIGEEKKNNLAAERINLFTPLRENMDQSKSTFTPQHKRTRKLIETVFGKVKDHFSLAYKFARNVDGFFSWVRAGLLAYSFSILFENEERLAIFLERLLGKC